MTANPINTDIIFTNAKTIIPINELTLYISIAIFIYFIIEFLFVYIKKYSNTTLYFSTPFTYFIGLAVLYFRYFNYNEKLLYEILINALQFLFVGILLLNLLKTDTIKKWLAEGKK
jgi:hypothetical protein